MLHKVCRYAFLLAHFRKETADAMQAQPDCVVCVFRQALNTIRLVSDDPEVHRRLLARLAADISRVPLTQTPAALSKLIYLAVADLTGVRDPFARQKRENNAAALRVLPKIEAIVAAADDKLGAAIHAAVAGNIIDLGIGHAFEIERDVQAVMSQPFAINAIGEFRSELGPKRKLLYLGDNAGEIVFDMVLVKEIMKTGTSVTFTVKSGPIINDATMEDAEAVGLTKVVNVIETGGDDIGVIRDKVSPHLAAAIEEADLILAKGHGNFETCDQWPENVYFLLKAKCEIVSRELGVRLGDIVFKHKPAARC